MIFRRNIIILDCTLRDGGYYNNWDFSRELVADYLEAMAASGVDYVELGLRNFSKEGFLGAFAYTTESYLSTLKLPEGPKYGVMVDAKTILTANMNAAEAIDTLFIDQKSSFIDFVRIAAHFHELSDCAPIVNRLKEKGYLVGLNMMQSGGKPDLDIVSAAESVSAWKCVDVLYFADSLGNMDSEEVLRITRLIRGGWTGDIGIHAHNNMSRALDNTITAFKEGVNWLDATVTGMGRGAGNTQLENLLTTLKHRRNSYSLSKLYELVINRFEPMRKEYGWGSNFLYFLAAQHSIHPTYIQKLLADEHYGKGELVGVVEFLQNSEDAASYKDDTMEQALSVGAHTFGDTVSGSSALFGKAEGREILLIANGPSTTKYYRDIQLYIETKKPVVITVNIIDSFLEQTEYCCISGNLRFVTQQSEYANVNLPVVLPKHRFKSEELEGFNSDAPLCDYGVKVEKEHFEVNHSDCIIPFDLTVAYALAICVNLKGDSISLVGFDGYEAHDVRQMEMIMLLSLFQKHYNGKIKSLTPTTYPLPTGSLYAP